MNFPALYAGAIAQIRASGVPWPVAAMQIRHGLVADHTCHDCRHLIYGERCGLSWSDPFDAAAMPACGKWEKEEAR